MLKILMNNCEAVQENSPLYHHRISHYREGQEQIAKVLGHAVRQGQLPETFDVRLGSIATIAFLDGLITTWIMFPGKLDLDTDIPALLAGLTHMYSRFGGAAGEK